MTNKRKTIRRNVRKTEVYQSSDSVQKAIIGTRQNLEAITKSLDFIQDNGVKVWEDISQNSLKNAEIIRELHINSLEVKF